LTQFNADANNAGVQCEKASNYVGFSIVAIIERFQELVSYRKEVDQVTNTSSLAKKRWQLAYRKTKNLQQARNIRFRLNQVQVLPSQLSEAVNVLPTNQSTPTQSETPCLGLFADTGKRGEVSSSDDILSSRRLVKLRPSRTEASSGVEENLPVQIRELRQWKRLPPLPRLNL
jgi:hypothetical protein